MTTSPAVDVSDYPTRYFAAWNERDIEAALQAFASTVTWNDPSLPATITTLEEAKGFFEGSWAAFPDLRFEAIGSPLVDATTGRVAQEWRMTGTDSGVGFIPGHSPSGNEFEVPGMDVWVVTADLTATSVTAYYDAASFARQLGVS